MDDEIEGLIAGEQYRYSDQEKERILLPIIKQELEHAQANNIFVHSWLGKIGLDIGSISSLADVPLLPTQMFKYFDLHTCTDELHRVLLSSSTTSQKPSRVPLCKKTAARQSRSLLAIMKSHLPNKRMPFLVLDSASSNMQSDTLSARGAVIRGFSILAKEIEYAFDTVDGRLVLNAERLSEFLQKHSKEDVLAVGFTYILWSELLPSLRAKNLSFSIPGLFILHGGGWKKMASHMVTKEEFTSQLANAFGTSKTAVMDFYGMVEQTGLVFIDCEQGYKHCPNFAEVKIRDMQTLAENTSRQPGYIEIMSVIPDSYPGMSILTEDIGEIYGHDCACGRKGKYFMFKSRAEKSEPRGCGDTFRERT